MKEIYIQYSHKIGGGILEYRGTIVDTILVASFSSNGATNKTAYLVNCNEGEIHVVDPHNITKASEYPLQ